jgi:hypothetical protein
MSLLLATAGCSSTASSAGKSDGAVPDGAPATDGAGDEGIGSPVDAGSIDDRSIDDAPSSDAEMPEAMVSPTCRSQTGQATSMQACLLASSAVFDAVNLQCESFCVDQGFAAGPVAFACTFPPDYWNAFLAAQPEGGSVVCPPWPQNVAVQCACSDAGWPDGA